ncbi:LacI family DNA-binding transcriptional regulator [Saccharopolyspora sp. TS4A08]|uniref:LacI family DNA-binding transcriptional regulator n=1 Tax=Saccharopolyspora ipomoeae TaxID=3042027 RepID=A0ABT6PGB5_9PSEU|nr:LacI family DNA-binding transcriptional regulator [Saccharopolyspora sp. TS4A08]MDI2026964.1 LacI family DNA-binding transcriptional regulator [Saccharopolyspora sp. TS4A08]
MVGIEEVARRAGVSPSTVSRALRGRSGVSDRTRLRITELAAELDYSISRSASGLATGRTYCIGVVVPFVWRWFFGQIIGGAEQVLRAAGYDLMLYTAGDEESRERFFRDLPVRGRVDAVLVLSMDLTEQESDRLRGLDLPLGLVGHEAEGFNSVHIDDRQGTRLAVQHLINLGHRDIAMIQGLEPKPQGAIAPIIRREAFLQTLRDNGIEPRPEWMVPGEFGISGGERAMDRLLAESHLPTAVFAYADELAMGALRSLRRHGRSVPEHMSIVGFDDHEMSEYVDLTTVAQPVQAQGATAAQLLIDQLDERSPKDTVVSVPIDLVVRGSTAPPPKSADERGDGGGW